MKKDLQFLKEMHTLSQKLLNDKYDITVLQYLDQMIFDWMQELEKKCNNGKKHHKMKKQKKLICVLCGQPWGVKNPYTNRCENEKCSGFCSWGYTPNKPESFTIDAQGNWHLKIPTTPVNQNK